MRRMKYNKYEKFLKHKMENVLFTGHEPKKLSEMLFDFQIDITRWAIRRGSAAIFADCGLGKTPMQLEWAKSVVEHTKSPVLILAPLAVSKQTCQEGKKFSIDVNICETSRDIVNGINITNYEKLHKFDSIDFSGVVLDESSILKNFTGKYRNQIIERFKYTPYRLACTATPAPNDYMELGNHCEFLGVMTISEMLSMFFVNDSSNVGNWRLKGHASKEFWKWICSWAVMLSKPSDFGYDDNGFILPKLNIYTHIVKSNQKPPDNQLFVLDANTLSERRQARKNTIKVRTEKAAKIIKESDASNDQWLIWCNLNSESKEATKVLNAVEVTGSDDPKIKEERILGFANKNVQKLVTKSKLAGFGMNWQNCHNIIFLGLSDSYEQYYQSIRRCWRFGQEQPVNVHIIITDIERNVIKNILRKDNEATNMREEMTKNMQDISSKSIRGLTQETVEYYTEKTVGNNWELYLGDSVEIIKNIKSETIGYSIFSPPFANLYTYSNSVRDMGNCKSQNDFLEHFAYLIDELFRVMIPGRLVSIHCMNLLATITHDGFIGLKDFRGDIIYLFQQKGFIYHSEVCIWKDPLIQVTRNKVLGLAHKQVVKDSSRCNQGLPDYIVTMRKPGNNPKPIERGRGFEEYIGEMELPKAQKNNDPRKNKFSQEIWQRYASPVWFDIRQTRVLNYTGARSNDDEKHICPLQLDTIERCLELWSTKEDIVLSPFAGVGSEIYCASQMERYGIGIELKESYYRQAIKNLQSLKQHKEKGLF
jgi:DNA modification methylase